MRRLIAVFVCALFSTMVVSVPSGGAQSQFDASEQLREAVTIEGVKSHVEKFAEIADEYADEGYRAPSTPGYDASADYVEGLLSEAGYDVEQQEFEYDVYEVLGEPSLGQTGPTPVDYVYDADFNLDQDFRDIEYSASGSVTAEVVPVDLNLDDLDGSDSGCQRGDFDNVDVEGKIALIRRGGCTFNRKAYYAQEAGAAAVIVFNQGNVEERTGLIFAGFQLPYGTPDDQETAWAAPIDIPGVFTTFDIGLSLAEGSTVSLELETLFEFRTTTNVIAQSATGDPNNVVLAGAHLDGVIEGPAVQDNGTGSAAILEIALQMAEEFDVNGESSELVNAVRFAWWGAEEIGSLGSTAYVESLAETGELWNIIAYQNYDMLGSPNFVRYVYDGDGSDLPASLYVPPGSPALEQVYLDYFEGQGLATEATAIADDSDHTPFCEYAIPCGGLFTGAQEIKTAEQVEIYGGTEGEPLDPCYHTPCDTLDNVNFDVLDEMSDAAAHAMAAYAFSETATACTLLDIDNLKRSKANRTMEVTTTPGPARFVELDWIDEVPEVVNIWVENDQSQARMSNFSVTNTGTMVIDFGETRENVKRILIEFETSEGELDGSWVGNCEPAITGMEPPSGCEVADTKFTKSVAHKTAKLSPKVEAGIGALQLDWDGDSADISKIWVRTDSRYANVDFTIEIVRGSQVVTLQGEAWNNVEYVNVEFDGPVRDLEDGRLLDCGSRLARMS